MRKLVLALAAAFSVPALATPPLPPPPPPAPPPRLAIVISVDQLSAELFEQYRPHFTGGLARLARGTLFRNGYQSHAATETCPGHSTILTGARPSRTGIIANSWIDQSVARPQKSVYCSEDPAVTPAPGGPRYTVSAQYLRVPTLGDLLKERSPGSRSVAVAGKDRAAIMLGGHKPDQRWYFEGGKFVTNGTVAAVPRSVGLANQVVASALAAPRPPLDPPPFCSAKATPYTIGRGKVVGNGRLGRAAGDVRAFQSSPEYDGAVLALAAAMIQELQLGRDTAADLLAIGLSSTDYVGHTFGLNGQEMCLQLLSLDRDLGDFFSLLDRSGIDYSVALTADHGGLDIPQRVPGAAAVDPALAAEEIGKRIAAKLSLAGPVLHGEHAADIYLDRALSDADRDRARAEALAIYRAHPQVEAVFTKEQLQATPPPSTTPDRWSVVERVRASFDPARSGDLYVVLKPKIAPFPATSDIASTHGSPWDYDRRVPIMFWRAGMVASERPEAIETVDIMPTLAAMLGLRADGSAVDGECLSGIAGIACPPVR